MASNLEIASAKTPRDDSIINTEPHTDFISPRLIDIRDGYGSRNFMVDAYWVTTE